MSSPFRRLQNGRGMWQPPKDEQPKPRIRIGDYINSIRLTPRSNADKTVEAIGHIFSSSLAAAMGSTAPARDAARIRADEEAQRKQHGLPDMEFVKGLHERLVADNAAGQEALRAVPAKPHRSVADWCNGLRTAWGALPFYTVDWTRLAAEYGDMPEPLSDANLDEYGDMIGRMRESWDEGRIHPPSD